MKEKTVKMNYVRFNKANPKLLLAFADYILKTIEMNGEKYNEEKYGSIKDMKKWGKPKLVKWLVQFDVSLKQKQ